MADYSSSNANIPAAAPRALNLDESVADATDRDSATPSIIHGAHINALRAELAALYQHLIADTWGYVEDAGGLDVTVHAGRAVTLSGGLVSWAKNAALTLADDDTSYVEVDSSGTISSNTTGFTAGSIPLAEVVTAASDISSITDKRPFFVVPGLGALDHGTLAGLGDDDHTQYLLADGTRALSGDLDAAGNGISDLGCLTWDGVTQRTIASGSVSAASMGAIAVETEGAAGSDDLDTITGGAAEQLLLVRAYDAAHTVVLKDDTGNMELGGSDITLDDTDMFVILLYDSALAKWLLVGGGGGAAGNHQLASNTHSDVENFSEAEGQIIYCTDSLTWTCLSPGTSGQALITGGAGAAPAWDDILLPDGTVALTANWDAGAYQIRAATFYSDVATGTAPLTISSQTVVANLNADLLDGYDATDLLDKATYDTDDDGYPDYAEGLVETAGPTELNLGSVGDGEYLMRSGTSIIGDTPAGTGDLKADGTVALTANWDAGGYEIRAQTFESDVATGTAPFTVASETVVSNLNADKLDGYDAADLLDKATYDSDDDGYPDHAEGLVESSGPTELAVGAISDGEWLKRVGNSIVSGTPAGSGDMTQATYDVGGDGKIDPAAGGTGLDSSASTGVPRVDAGTWSIILDNLGASAAPTVNDDSSSGYSVSSRWYDESADRAYVCLDASVGAAVWIEITQTATLGLADLTDVGSAGTTAGNVLRADGSAYQGGQLGHGDLSSVSADQHHARQHDIDATADHVGVSGGTQDNLVSLDANNLPADSGIAKADVPQSRVVWVNIPLTGEGSDISTGLAEVDVNLPPGTIQAVRILSPDTGSITLDLWVDSYANYPPTDADSICGGNEPALSSAQKMEDSTLTSWTTSIAEDDILALNVDSCTGIQSCTLALKLQV